MPEAFSPAVHGAHLCPPSGLLRRHPGNKAGPPGLAHLSSPPFPARQCICHFICRLTFLSCVSSTPHSSRTSPRDRLSSLGSLLPAPRAHAARPCAWRAGRRREVRHGHAVAASERQKQSRAPTALSGPRPPPSSDCAAPARERQGNARKLWSVALRTRTCRLGVLSTLSSKSADVERRLPISPEARHPPSVSAASG